MSLRIIQLSADVVSLSEAKEFLGVDHDDDDAVINGIIETVDDWLAGPQGWLGRSLGETDLELTIQDFPCHPYAGIILPRPPIIEVESIAYHDEDEAEQALSSDVYRVVIGDDGLSRIVLKQSESWPATHADHGVTITYRAGYVDESESPIEDSVPPALRTAILMAIARLYASYQTVGLTIMDDSFMAKMFAPFRVYV